LPIWVMAYRYQDRVFRFLINGQTGRATGQAPTSWKKLVAVVLIAILILLLLLGLLGVGSAMMNVHAGQGGEHRRENAFRVAAVSAMMRNTVCC